MRKVTDTKAYLAGLPEEHRAALEGLRKAIRSAAPEATEGVSYNMLAYKVDGKGLVCYDAFKDHYSLFPMGGSVFDVVPELVQYRSGKGTIRFEYGQPLPTALVKKAVKARLVELEARAKK